MGKTKNMNMAGGWNLKLTICFIVSAHEPLYLGKRSSVQWKIVDIPKRFICIIIFFNGPFECSDGGIFKLLRWVQNLRQSTWGHNILYADRSSEDEQLSITPLVRESKNTNMAGGWMLKFTFYFMGSTHELSHLDNWSSVPWKIMDVPTSFVWTIIFFDGAFEYGGISKFWAYVGSNAELLCADLCNYGRCRVFVNCFILYCQILYNCFNWLDNGIILKPQFHFMVYLLKLFWILEIRTRWPKNTEDY
jgi:hypothetical protein